MNKKRWEIMTVSFSEAEKYLKRGYEPFGYAIIDGVEYFALRILVDNE